MSVVLMGLMVTAFAGDPEKGGKLIDNVVITSHGDTPHTPLMNSINEAVGEACAFTEKQGKSALDKADKNGDGKIGEGELSALAEALNGMERKARCKTIALVTDGKS